MEKHITNYRAAKALTDKGRNAGEGAAHHSESSTGLSRNGLRKQTAGLSKSSAKKSAVKNGAKGMSDMASGLGSRPGKSA